MTYAYQRTIHLADTDAAGVIYFARLLHICHEAYEICLAESGFQLSSLLQQGTVALPIVHTEMDFYQPITWGDRLTLCLQPTQEKESQFRITYLIFPEDQNYQQTRPLAKALTRHVAIHPKDRSRCALPEAVQVWLRNAPKPENSKI